MVGYVMVETKERKETGGMVEGADGREEGVEMMAAVAGRGCMERASGREGSPEERRDLGVFSIMSESWFWVVAYGWSWPHNQSCC